MANENEQGREVHGLANGKIAIRLFPNEFAAYVSYDFRTNQYSYITAGKGMPNGMQYKGLRNGCVSETGVLSAYLNLEDFSDGSLMITRWTNPHFEMWG
ncbi:MAG TPA: hypothetical protein VMC07_01560, partial [Candidatus Omnitrophota bacterium]|nr:hypothetical protein [Candidatus Omnitrophota bacterium]